MRERPIIFSVPMVRAILEGRKTQTRRVVKGLPEGVARVVQMRNDFVFAAPRRTLEVSGRTIPVVEECVNLRCPYGVPGDRLWAKETWGFTAKMPDGFQRGHIDCRGPWLPDKMAYRADDPPGYWCWRASIHMPRWASRLTLEISDVRVQRVQDISDDDLVAEAAAEVSCDTHSAIHEHPREDFVVYWDSLNAKRGFSWAANPWVWALTFRRLDNAAH